MDLSLFLLFLLLLFLYRIVLRSSFVPLNESQVSLGEIRSDHADLL